MQNENDWVNELLAVQEESSQMTEKQRRIVAAAIEIFAEKGYAATSTSEIAKKADVAEGTIFRHYKTKKDLLLSISASLMSKLIAPILTKELYELVNKRYDCFEDFLRAVIRDRREFAKSHKELLKVLIQEVPFHPEMQHQFKKTIALPFLDSLFKAIHHFKENGEIIDLPEKTIARMAATPIIGYLLMKYILDVLGDTDEQVDEDEMIQFLMHGLSKNKTAE